MKKIYICHQYYEPSHFKALYECAEKYGYEAMELIVLNPASAVRHRDKLVKQDGLEIAENWYRNNSVNKENLWLLRDELIIFGVAPYDRLLAQYQNVLAHNYSIYMTSWGDWHSDNVPYPYQENKIGFLKTLTHYINGVACVSQQVEQEVASWNEVTQVVNHAVNVSEYKKKEDCCRKGRYIFLGRLVEIKNISVIIEYLKKVHEKYIEVDIAGEGPLKETLEQYAKYDKRLRLLGHLSKDKIKKCLCEYDYLILPSYQEAFGIVLLESLACGVPCITSDALGPKEIIHHDKTGIIFHLNEEDGFRRAMDYSMELSDNQYKIMCNNAVADCEKYDVNNIVKKWIRLFERVCVKKQV